MGARFKCSCTITEEELNKIIKACPGAKTNQDLIAEEVLKRFRKEETWKDVRFATRNLYNTTAFKNIAVTDVQKKQRAKGKE